MKINLNMFMASLIPMLVFTNILMWDDLPWIRFLAIYWQVISWGLCFILLKLVLTKGEKNE